MPLVCELKVCEYETFKAYYCGLCKTLKRKYRKSAVLNYDCTFIYLLGDGLKRETAECVPVKCGLHPFRGKKAVFSDAAEYAADLNLLMAYAKLEDDVRDSGKISARLRLPAYRRAYEKAAARNPDAARLMHETAERLHELEAAASADTDAAADTYARLFGSVLMELDVLQSHILYDLGYNLGRWVYLIDAYDDIKKDRENGEYHVFVNKYGMTGPVPEPVQKEVLFVLNYTLAQAAAAFARLKLEKNRGILENIVRLGLREQTKKVLLQSEGKTDESIRGSGRN